MIRSYLPRKQLIRCFSSSLSPPSSTSGTKTPDIRGIDRTSRLIPSEESALNKSTSKYPRSVQAIHFKPLRHEAEYGTPSCDLQLRSFSARNLEFFSDFALRAAYYLKLPAFGPVPLPRQIERWTVPRSSFIFKKSQENFERITLRRLIQIRDGDPEVVQVWLAFLRKHAYYGVGMKANVWEFSPVESHLTLDEHLAGSKESLDDPNPQATIDEVAGLLRTRRYNTL